MVYTLEELTMTAPVAVTDLSAEEMTPPAPPPKRHSYWRSLGMRLVISLAVSGFILTLPGWWPQGAEFLRKQAGQGEIGPVQAATQELLQSVLSGEPLPEAIATFCQEISYGTAQD